jgi:hypothetical protein
MKEIPKKESSPPTALFSGNSTRKRFTGQGISRK